MGNPENKSIGSSDMARFNQKEAIKGSQKWIQVLVNQRTDVLNNEINLSLDSNEIIEWYSPLASENFKE
jgi:hypothetical protein